MPKVRLNWHGFTAEREVPDLSPRITIFIPVRLAGAGVSGDDDVLDWPDDEDVMSTPAVTFERRPGDGQYVCAGCAICRPRAAARQEMRDLAHRAAAEAINEFARTFTVGRRRPKKRRA